MTGKKRIKTATISAIAGLVLAGQWLATPEAAAFELDLPVACEIGTDCFVQSWFDTDPSEAAADFTCGNATYDGHKGTDFRVPTLAEMAAGVAVVAGAPGRVKAVRDGMADRMVTDETRAAVAEVECGNGVVIDHGDGWETQYCHMRRGSVRVRRGDSVEAGAELGQIGNSGLAEFPHVHLSVRKDGVHLDPYTGRPADGTCATGADRGMDDNGLWSERAAAILGPPESRIIGMGFAPAPVETRQSVARSRPLDDPSPDWPAMVVFVQSINLKAGDVQEIAFTTPDGRTTTSRADPTDRAKAFYVIFGGRKRPADGWPDGTYTGRYRLLRDGATVVEKEISAQLR